MLPGGYASGEQSHAVIVFSSVFFVLFFFFSSLRVGKGRRCTVMCFIL